MASIICSLYDLFPGRQFERALAYVGIDYLSFTLWDKYIEYEYSQQEWSRLAMIYTRILENPNQQIDRYFNSFRELVAHRPLTELRTAEEAAAAGGQEFEGEVNPDAVEQSPKPVSAGLTGAEELEKYIAIREEMYKKAKEFHSKIIGFETAIRRPYFHVRPLNGGELENWHNYLDFIEAEDDLNKVCYLPNHLSVKLGGSLDLYLRGFPFPPIEYFLCISPWISLCFISFLSVHTQFVILSIGFGMFCAWKLVAVWILLRMHLPTQFFVKRRPNIHPFAAHFSEHYRDIPRARAAYQLVHTEILPGLLEVIIKYANMEHRLENVEDAFSLYEQAIAIEKGKELSQTLPLMFAQYSRFVYSVSGNVEKAREIIGKAFENCQLSKPLMKDRF